MILTSPNERTDPCTASPSRWCFLVTIESHFPRWNVGIIERDFPVSFGGGNIYMFLTCRAPGCGQREVGGESVGGVGVVPAQVVAALGALYVRQCGRPLGRRRRRRSGTTPSHHGGHSPGQRLGKRHRPSGSWKCGQRGWNSCWGWCGCVCRRHPYFRDTKADLIVRFHVIGIYVVV